MANQNFTNFTLKTPTSGDFLVGYNADGSDEYRTTVNALLSSYATNTSLNAASSVLLPVSVYSAASGSFATRSFTDSKYLPLSTTSVNYTNLSATNAFFQNVTAGNVLANSLNTNKFQTIYEGKKIEIGFNSTTGPTISVPRSNRLMMITATQREGDTLNLSENANNRFLEGDVVGVWARNNNLRLYITYTPFGGSPIAITSFLGNGGYNTGTIALVFRNGTFIVQTFQEQNISGIAAELRVESIQPNDPGTPFNVLGRGTFVHGLTLNAGDLKFTNGSDHFHLIQQGTGGSYQTINGGYNWTTSRICQHTLAARGAEFQANIVAAYGASLTANQVDPPYGITPETSANYLAIWTNADSTSLTVGKTVYFSVSPSGPENESLRKIGFTAASYPAKIISTNAVGSVQSTADVPVGYSLPATAAKHFRIQPVNLSTDNWLGAALIRSGANTALRTSTVPEFTNTVLNTGEVLRFPEKVLLVPDSQKSVLSADGGYNTVSMRNGCELVFNLTNTPLLSSKLPFLYEGLPVIVLLSNTTDLSAVNYGGLTPNSAKSQYGLPYDTNSSTSNPYRGYLLPKYNNYFQQTYDGYIYRSSPTQVIIRLGQQRGTEESRVQKFTTPNIEYFLDRPGILSSPTSFTKSLPPGGLSALEVNGYNIGGLGNFNSAPLNLGPNKFGIWSTPYSGQTSTLPPIMKGGIEFTSFNSISSSDLQLIVYAGNKDPVHRPVAGMQLFSYERYPNIQPELKETGSVVSKFALGPSCEGFDRDTAVVGFGSTAYHYRSMAIGHRVETLSAEEIAIGIDNNVLRIGLSSLSVSSPMLSSNGVDTFLKIKQDNGSMYGLKLQLL